MIKIVITGVESTGKTTLAEALSHSLQLPLLPEYSRAYLTKRNGYYTQEDLSEISRVLLAREIRHAENGTPMIICDTSLLVMKVWSIFKYGTCDAWITSQLEKYKADLYLLPDIYVPYVKDPLRENPLDRQELFDMYIKELTSLSAPYHVLEGTKEKKLQTAIDIIQNYDCSDHNPN